MSGVSATSKTSAIRFKGFDGEWEEKTMTSCSSKIGDGLHGTPKYTDGTGIYFINGNNLVSGSIFITEETKQVDKEKQSKADISLDINTILISINGTIGNLAWYRNETIMLGKSVAYISLENCAPSYLYFCLHTRRINDYFTNNLTGSTIKNLGLKTIRETKVVIPKEKKEQTKIGQLFQQLDTLINQHQQKHDKLLTVKKALLEKMFPQQGETQPAIRFKGFSGAWEEKALGEVADIVGGGTPSTGIAEYWGGNIDWYSPTEIGKQVYATGSEKKITALGLEKSSAKVLPKDTTVLFTSRAGIGDMAILKKAGATNQGFQSFIMKEGHDSYFVYSAGYLIKDYALIHASGSTFLEISGKQLGKMQIKTPDFIEQTKIGQLFQQLDILINQHQRQLTKLNNVKQSLLSKMFV